MRTLIILSILTCALHSYSQNSTYSSTYDNFGNANKSLVDNDGNLISFTSNSNSFSILKTKVESGDVVYSKTFISDDEVIIGNVVLAQNGDYLVASFVGGSLTGIPMVTRLSSDGNIIWQKHFGDGAETGIYSIAEASNGDIYIAGYILTPSLTTHGIIMRIASSGDFIWANEIDQDYTEFRALSFLQDGTVLAVGKVSTNLLIMNIGDSGNLVNASSIDNPGFTISGTDIVSVDNGFLIGGIASGQFGHDDFLAIKLDDAGDFHWAKVYGGFFEDKCTDVAAVNNTGFVLSGFSVSENEINQMGEVIRISSNGNLIWSRKFGGDEVNDFCSDVNVVNSNELIVNLGNYSENGSLELIKTDLSGNTSCGIEPGSFNESDFTAVISSITFGLNTSVGESIASLLMVETDVEESVKCEINLAQTNVFQNIIVGPNNDLAYGIAQGIDGGFITAGSCATGVHGSDDIMVSKLSDVGDTIWNAFYGSAGSEYAVDILAESDGNYIFLSREGKIAKIDETGDVLLVNDYGTELGSSLLRLRSGGVLMVDNNSLSYLDEDLSRVWQRSYFSDVFFKKATETSNGDILVTGFKTGGVPSLVLARVTSNGALLWSKSYDSGSDDTGRSIIELVDGSIMVVGYTNGFSNPNFKGLIGKFDSNGDVIWFKTYHNNDFAAFEHISRKAEKIFVSGELNQINNGSGFLMEINEDGDVTWANGYGGGSFRGHFNKHIHTFDGGFALAGYSTIIGNGSYDFYHVKTDSIGKSINCRDFVQDVTITDVWMNTTTVTNNFNNFSFLESSSYLKGQQQLLMRDLNLVISKNVEHVVCNGEQNGSIDITVGNGVKPYSYTWDHGVNDEDISGLLADTFVVNVMDATGCVLKDSIIVFQNEVLTSNFTAVNPSCSGDVDGMIEATVIGGKRPYNFQWNNAQTDSIAINLGAANYALNVTDSNGCLHSNIITLSDPEPVEISFSSYAATCGASDGSITATAIGGDNSFLYSWDNLVNGSLNDNIESGTYEVTVEDGNGCSLTEFYDLGSQVTPVEICLITVDTNSLKNVIVWEKEVMGNIAGYNVYRNVLGAYQNIGYVPYEDLSEFTDNSFGVDPNVTSYRYQITKVDTCGNESEFSAFHETMHLTTNQGTNGEVNLIWDEYEGFPFVAYRIMKDTTDNGLFDYYEVDAVGSGVFTWTDGNPGSYASYSVVVDPSILCSSTKANDYNSSRSNRSSGISDPSGGLSVQEFSDDDFSIYPNPNNGSFAIQSNNALIEEFEIIDAFGKLILTRTVNTDTEQIELNVAAGIYFVRLKNETYSTIKRIMIR